MGDARHIACAGAALRQAAEPADDAHCPVPLGVLKIHTYVFYVFSSISGFLHRLNWPRAQRKTDGLGFALALDLQTQCVVLMCLVWDHRPLKSRPAMLSVVWDGSGVRRLLIA